jgi:hypothetical protein
MALFVYLSIYAFVLAPMVLPPVFQLVVTIIGRARINLPSPAHRTAPASLFGSAVPSA